jgi:mannose-6-phosphate isomerase-like protein (cupin superfamily)
MKAFTRVTPLVLVGLIAALTLSAAGGGKGVAMPAGEMKWVESPAMKGLSVATLWGDPSKGAYGAFKKVAGGTDLGFHSHSFDQKVIAVSGTFDFQFKGEGAKELGPGSYVSTPAHVVHSAKCRAGADCVYFEQSAGKSDYIPAK